jgi:hypothetical protein
MITTTDLNRINEGSAIYLKIAEGGGAGGLRPTLSFTFLLNQFDYHYTHFLKKRTGADAIKKFTPSLGIPYLGV